MKRLLNIILVSTIVFASSCKKEEIVPPVQPVQNITVEYRVSSTSGHFNVTYLAPSGTSLAETKEEINRMTFTYSFDWKSGQKLLINAKNATPSGDEVIVEIYVNGTLFRSGSANAPNALATAEGIY